MTENTIKEENQEINNNKEVEKIDEKQIEKLKENILRNEEKKEFHSEKFLELENRVKDQLKIQKSDTALSEITFWALYFWSSDLHFDNIENETIVRFRIDWVLVDILKLEKNEYKKLLERMKYSASLKLNITDVPQDWKYSIKKESRKLDVRISTLPTKYWENIVARVLDSGKAIIDFKKLWFYWSTKRMVERAIQKKNWLILVTWPTWSGKTTTLYTIISKLNTRDKKIITLEDPIEYELPWIIQSEVSEKKWYSFEMWLKALLRQDPDIIMLWEIRDYSTLNIATNASLTGHLVLSTLHTKSAAETIDRILNMGLKNYIMASAIDSIIAQRLVRRICPHCKVEVEKTKQEERLIEALIKDINMKWLKAKNMKLYKWEWCEHCANSGYKWRVWVYEVIVFNEEIRNLVREWKTTKEIIEQAKKSDMMTMKEDWILKSIKWETTIEEVLRVI